MATPRHLCYFSHAFSWSQGQCPTLGPFTHLLDMVNKTFRPWTFAILGLLISLGCTSLPFQQKERTSIITPAMRIAAIRESAAAVTDADPQEQAKLVDDLAAQIQTERDPLVRQAIQESVGNLQVPLAHQMLVAGLQDDDPDVRVTCCQLLGRRGEVETVPILRGILSSNASLDLKLAATDAIGQINSTESVGALSLALKSRDPALQYAAVESMKNLTNEKLGNDVSNWIAYADQHTQQATPAPDTSSEVQVASATAPTTPPIAPAAPNATTTQQPSSPFANRILPQSPYH